MEHTLTTNDVLKRRAARALADGRLVARAAHGESAEKAQDLVEHSRKQAAVRAQKLAKRGRKRYGRKARRSARRLEQVVPAVARRLPIDTLDRSRRRARRRAALVVAVLVGGALAVYVAWRARQEVGGSAEADFAPDPFGAAAQHASDASQPPASATS